MKKSSKRILFSIIILVFLGTLTIPCFLYEPLNLWIRYSVFKDPSAMNKKAYILFKQKDYDGAKKLYWEAYYEASKKDDLSSQFEKNDSIVSLIMDWYKIKDYKASIVAANEELKDDPDSDLALEYLGKNYDALKNYEKAFLYYSRFVPDEVINTKHVSKEVEQKSEWYEELDAHKYDEAVFRLAIYYTYGQGCSIDLGKAANLWQYLDNLRSISATYNLALCYLNGDGVSKDKNKGFQLCKKAADRGDKGAMKLLSELYSKGIGCTQSEEAANHWKKLSEENSDE